MKNKIYIHTENEEYGVFSDLKSGLVSWSDDRNSDSDLEFISVNLILARIKELEDINNRCTIIDENSIHNFNIMSVQINQLKNLIK
jgi:hypothetical protein